MNLTTSNFLILSFFIFFFFTSLPNLSSSKPMNCSDTSRLCTSFLAFKPNQNQSFSVIQSMFDVLPADITADISEGYFFIKKNCSCLTTTHQYTTNTTFTIRQNVGYVYNVVVSAYSGLAFPPNTKRAARAGSVVSVQLLCGCSSGLWNYLMSYVAVDGDSVQSLSSRFGVSMDRIEEVNGILNLDNITAGDVLYIPLDSVPGEPYETSKINPQAPSPAPASSLANGNLSDDQVNHTAKSGSHVPYIWIVGGLGVVLALLVLCILVCICLRSSSCSSSEEDGNGHNFQILRKSGFFCGSGRYNCCRSGDFRQTNGENQSHHQVVAIPKALGDGMFEIEKPMVFTYEEIRAATDEFSDSNLLGHGNYGSVYFGLLREQEVAVKRMTATKTKEFAAEMKVLCKVHHSNLVELIGYAATVDELFVVYEYVQKGMLKNHLHDPQSKGNTPLSWIMRNQIALDAARGLEYIHEHTKTHYVHRDIKTSNILLDEAFRGKISDFGLAKLVEKTGEGEISVTKVVGTYGYLAPEYLSDGLATSKSDVYAFGVVLFEIISGREAVIRTEAMGTKNPERRPLASIMLAALKNSPDSMNMASLKEFVDPNMMDLYPHDCLFKIAMLAKQCVDDDPILRPNMKQVVISLSQILLSSIEWEATLAGNSQVFSGLVQGR
ncbi:Serine-threonine/tyrosine-protein kinase catalytic domain [Arabidopsis thaliana x Arabidopsis arenosa]|uniref:Serine-threonine/tyrosine-protein kinase catalytic domain n=1 Tax=Arabidopsis thaliana x Arabidopsis arenosa TaxID=1240361 RepID=A0A8T2CID7_9BRAS|nr:Serine-threonine/tyrosine-protein kinase catalytic domain [Arabidopsis thaliana x Arabidopsis arenosa]